MSFPEWGNSYNALHVPLSDWQCSLVPARDVQDVDRGWQLSYEERQKARKAREEQIEQDQRDFDRYFQVSIQRRDARACSDFSVYIAFISEHLGIWGLSAPVDGEGVTRILRDAVRDGRLVPAINRAWRGSRRVARPYAPQSWPKRAPDPKPTVYGVRDGQFVPLDDNGYFIDRTPYIPVAAKLGNASTPLADAEPFDYWPGDAQDGDAFDIAKTPNEGDPGTWYTNPGSGQMRLYGDDRRAVVDFDFDHDHGQGIPHAHNWDNGVRGIGVPFSLLP
ncbi:conserved hypothetical protein [Paraburkholderia sacchari]|uniref:hypothetical protein n=1 Tax=Paraburkholderia sacchari TaxID=159450 RepID=UPI0039A5DB5C